MNKGHRLLRTGSSIYVGIAVLGATAAAAFAAGSPALPELGALMTSVACSSSTTACVTGNNANSGAGVTGISKKGAGVLGTGTSSYGVKATSSSSYGVYGSSSSGQAGVVGTTKSRDGVYGYTSGNSGGTGVYGASVTGYGVYGATTSGSGIGVIGYETGSGTGTYGFSTSGYGAEAITGGGYGLLSEAYGSGTAIYASANTGYGIIAQSNGSLPVYARNTAGNGGDFGGTYIGLIGRAPASGGFPLVLTDNSGNNLFYVDGAGNVSYRGGLFSFARSATGAVVKSYSAKSTLPTVEDTGTAQLVRGAALVRLDPTFAASIDGASSYRVFLTPNGDTRGLFVATKAPGGFVVRESQAGHASVSFDYRIVATALGQSGQRMAPFIAEAAPRGPSPVIAARPLGRPAALAKP
jgi:hypothetical protein